MPASDFPVRNGNNAVIIPAQVLDGFEISDEGLRGTTAQRPSTGRTFGMGYYDTDLQKIIYWNGSAWVDFDGTTP